MQEPSRIPCRCWDPWAVGAPPDRTSTSVTAPGPAADVPPTDPGSLESRLRHYEDPDNDPGALTWTSWRVLLLTGVLLPAACLVLGWLLGGGP
jgi:hypothetical protein